MTRAETIKTGLLFVLAIFLAVIGLPMLFSMHHNAYAAPEPKELSRSEMQYVNERIAPYCQSPGEVKPAEFTMANPPTSPEVPVFIYHRVTERDPPSHEVIHPMAFKEQMQYLKDHGYNTITTQQLVDYMSRGLPVPPKSVVLTFDDGWKDMEKVGKWLKDDYDFAATFYIISGFFENKAYVDEEDVQELAKNPKFEIGSHTHTHFVKYEGKINQLELCTMAGEMVSSKHILERVTGKPVKSIAWPYGYNTKEAISVAGQLGYTSTALVYRDAKNQQGNSPLFIRRMNIDGTCPITAFREMLETHQLKECMQ